MFRLALGFVLSSCIFLLSCQKPHEQNAKNSETHTEAKPDTPIVAKSKSRGDVKVSLAPFDRFPANSQFPLVFRFESPVAPADRTAAENFEAIRIDPSRSGTWRWESDSQLVFQPVYPWQARDVLRVTLGGLKTSDGTANEGPRISPEVLEVSLPPAIVSLAKCEMEIVNRAPLIQVPKIGLRFNYPPTEQMSGYYQLNFTREGTAEQLHASTSSTGSGRMAFDLTGPKIFRPQSPAVVGFQISAGMPMQAGSSLIEGTSCEIPLDPKTWDELADRKVEAKVEIPLAELNVKVPTVYPRGTESLRQPLTVAFQVPWQTRVVPHGKARGLTLVSGLTLEPAIAGTWKTDDDNSGELTFTPKDPWPIGQAMTLRVDPAEFPAVQLRSPDASFRTADMSCSLTSSELHTDPTNPLRRNVTAELEFSHIPSLSSLKSKYSFQLRVEPQKEFRKTISSEIKPDPKSPRKFYLVSENIDLAEEPGEVLINVSNGVTPEVGGAAAPFGAGARVRIPSKLDVYQIGVSSVSVVKTPEQDLRRVLSLETTEPTAVESLASALEFYLLPDCKEKKNKKICKDQMSLGDESRVFPEVLAASEKITLQPLPGDETTSPNMFNFGFEAPGRREVFLRIAKGLESKNRYALSSDFRKVFFAQEFPKQLSVMHSGSLLSLSGDKNLGISLRNVGKVRYELARVVSRDVHHFVSATYGNFTKPYYNFYNFGLDQLAEKFSYVEGFPEREPGKTVYTAVDFSRFMSNGASPRGLFVLSVKEEKGEKAEQEEVEASDEGESEGEGEECETTYDEEGNESSSCGEESGGSSSSTLEDKRLVLLTDLGLMVKNSLAGEQDVFVVSFRSGEPVSGATIKLLGQNGIPLFTAVSKADGRVKFPPTKELKAEKRPLVYTVEKDGDFSFLPFERGDRQLNFTRFDTNGVVNSDEERGLRALVFTDRGIYRPGEEARFGVMLRKRNLELPGDNLPLEISITDPRGVEIERKKFKLSKLGLDDYRWNTANALTGTYTIGVYLIRSEEEGDEALLGSSSFRVDEFQPDKLSVKANYVDATPEKRSGWASQAGSFQTTVLNLFGTPAVGNKVQGTLLAKPWDGTFAEYPDYLFYVRREDSSLPQQSESLGEQLTDAEGRVSFTPDISRFDEKAFRLDFAAEAFEKDSGRSVVATASSLVSDSTRFVGWKADGSLDYIAKGAGRKLSFTAIGADLKPVAVNDLTLEVEQTKMISALVKQPNGTLSYEQTPKRTIIKTESFVVSLTGSEFSLETAEAGDFLMRVKDASGEILNAIHYTVHGEGNSTFMADRKAEVGIRLSRTSVLPGEELELSINTPYTGFGLITIERERVYATQWFKAATNSSIQKITVPKDIVGNAYVSVAFVRSLDSKDIFASPLSYGVKAFTIAKAKYTEGISLQVPEIVKPGTNVNVHYKLDEKAKLLLYAVDEGILQFARYKNPDPVGAFMPKRALEVETYQILDLILPDHKIVEALSSTGGSEDVGLGKFKNPFARKRRAPMAFWSGIIPEGALEGNVSVPVPDYFNGTIRIIAVAVSEKKLGIESTKTVAQHDFVIDPQIPYFVSPGDEFEVGATVANTVKGSGKNVKLKLTLSTSTGLELIEPKPVELLVPEGEDKAFRLRLRAKDVLGEQEVKFRAEGIGRDANASDSMSVRPPQIFRTDLQSGIYRPDKDGPGQVKLLPLKRQLYAEQREVRASMSESPLSAARALIEYLKEYPYGCTEQLTSAAFPAVLFGADPEMGYSEKDVETYTKRLFAALNRRQRADGTFNVFDGLSTPDKLFTVYAAHLLLEAKARSLEVPEEVYARTLAWLKEFSSAPNYDLTEQLVVSYALYLRARSGEVVSKEASAFVSDLDRQWGRKWKDSAITLFLAGTFKIMQLDKEADELLRKPPEIWNDFGAWPYTDPAFYGSLYIYISSLHFGEDKALSPLDTVVPIARMIEEKAFTSFNTSFAVLGLKAYADKRAALGAEGMKIEAATDEQSYISLPIFGKSVLQSEVPDGSKNVRYTGRDGKVYFYELSESGYDRNALAPVAAGISIDRELKNSKGELTSSIALNDKLEVTLFLKSSEALRNVAVVELIPGGFEIDLSEEGLANRKSLHDRADNWIPSFIEIQEDRIVFFGDLSKESKTFTYRLKPLARGKFTHAGVFAEGMYDPKKRVVAQPTSIEVK